MLAESKGSTTPQGKADASNRGGERSHTPQADARADADARQPCGGGETRGGAGLRSLPESSWTAWPRGHLRGWGGQALPHTAVLGEAGATAWHSGHDKDASCTPPRPPAMPPGAGNLSRPPSQPRGECSGSEAAPGCRNVTLPKAGESGV